jgi:hypothetical protein
MRVQLPGPPLQRALAVHAILNASVCQVHATLALNRSARCKSPRQAPQSHSRQSLKPLSSKLDLKLHHGTCEVCYTLKSQLWSRASGSNETWTFDGRAEEPTTMLKSACVTHYPLHRKGLWPRWWYPTRPGAAASHRCGMKMDNWEILTHCGSSELQDLQPGVTPNHPLSPRIFLSFTK